MTNLEIAVTFVLTFAGSCLALFIITRIIRLVILLRKDLRYVNMEINRTTGEDRDYWLAQRRRLWYDWLTVRK